MPGHNISAALIVRNEAENIAACLESIRGLDEIVIVSRLRDRWAMGIIGGLIVCLLGICTTAIWGGWRLAADVGQIGGAMTTRLEQVERQVSQDQTEIQRMSRASSDGQTTVLVTLGEMREQLRAIDARLQRVEDAQGRTRR